MVSRQPRLNGPSTPDEWTLVASGGPWPFVSWATYRLGDGSEYTWRSRHHRKGAGPEMFYADRAGLRTTRRGDPIAQGHPWRHFWAPHRLAWWVAITFIVGSVLFVAGAAGSLVPSVFGGQHRMSVFAEVSYFIGATLYTIGIYGQLLEALNCDERIDPSRRSHAPNRFRWFVTRAGDLARIEILIPFVFLIGSLTFNYETTFALGSVVGALPKVAVWETSLIGSIFFLMAGLLQFIEAGNGYLSANVRDISWWIGLLFTVGGAGFIIGSLPGLGTPGLPNAGEGSGPAIVKIGFLTGGIAYLTGSYLMLPELFTQLRQHPRAQVRDSPPTQATQRT
jgi:hypothetical protein